MDHAENRKLTARVYLVAFIAVFAVPACTPHGGPPPSDTGTSAASARNTVGFAQFPDIAVPAGATMDVERSLVLGARDAWIGRLSMNTGQSPTVSYDFFLREMPKYRWEEITTVRSEISVLTFSRDGRVATIQIRKKTLGGSKIDVTVSPRGTPQSPTLPFSSEPTKEIAPDLK